MSSKKIFRWIDENNRKTCLKICQDYYGDRQKKISLFLNYSFLVQVTKRLVFVFINLFRKNKILKQGQPKTFVSNSPKLSSHLFKKFLGLYNFSVPGVVPEPPGDRPLRFKNHLSPLVTIIVDLKNYSDHHIYNCLYSIFLHTENIQYELLAQTADQNQQIPVFLKQAENIRIINVKEITNSVPYNIGISESTKGKYLCLIEGNLQVTSLWLSNMLAVFDHQEEATAVVPKVLYSYGLLKEAGGKFNHQDLPKYNVDQQDPLYFSYNYIKNINHLSQYCNLISKNQYASVEKLNKKIFYQPLSVVILSDAYPEQNLLPDNSNTERKNNRQPFNKLRSGNTILFIDAFLPAYDNNSGSRRIFELIKIFQSLNFKVLFLPADGKKTEPYFSEMINQGIRILYPFIPHRNPVDELKEVLNEIDIAWISRPELNHFYAPFFKDQPSITWVYDTVDLHFIREERLARLQNLITKEMSAKISTIKAQEVQLSKEADLTIAITDTEADILIKESAKNVKVIPNVHFPYTGPQKTFEQRKDLCFIGGFHHTPNVDATLWLVKDIMPLVWNINPGIKLVILGSNPTREILELQSARVEITGYIEDVSNYFTSSRIFVAPLRFGAGMKGKIGHSLEYGLPVITTDIGVEGMGLIDDKNVLLANNDKEFATQILRLYNDQALWEKIASNSLSAIDSFSPARIRERLKEIFADTKAL
jgi:hypothetical protein